MKIIHLEDDAMKHSAIKRVITSTGIRNEDIVWVNNVEEGIEQIENAIKEGEPFDLAITDMHYPLKRGMHPDEYAGETFINTMTEKGINIPIIVCSSFHLVYRNVYGNLWYSNRSDWENELKALLNDI